ncbi:hypothetical protein Ddc_01459 [Ditylenchus destructor]|nr:hypothetical protein Ddc_01459 [Ditylenchus destructor]
MTANSSNIMPLSRDDILAGSILIILGLIFLFAYFVELLAIINAQLLKHFVGFRFILAANLADVINILLYGIYGGLVILTKSLLLPLEWKGWLTTTMDATWFVMCYMSVVIAITRLMCVAWPSKFRQLSSSACYAICFAVWFISFAKTVFLHSTNWYVVIWFDPCCYGLADNIEGFNGEGTSLLYNLLYSIIIPISIGCYVLAVGLLAANRKKMKLPPYHVLVRIFFVRFGKHPENIKSTSKLRNKVLTVQQQEVSSTEVRLILPCFLSAALLLGIRLTIQLSDWGNWSGFIVLLLYCLHSGTPPLLRIAFSRRLRREITNLFLFENSTAVISISHKRASK